MRRNKDGGSGLQHLVRVFGIRQRPEHAGLGVVRKHTARVGVLCSPFGGDQECVASSSRKPERKQRQWQSHPMVVATRYELGSLIVGGPKATAGKGDTEAVSRRPLPAPDNPQLPVPAPPPNPPAP